MKHRFRVGEKVRIVCAEYLIKNFKTSTSSDINFYYVIINHASYCVTAGMLKYLGQIVTIAKETREGNYNIEEDGGTWFWNDVVLRNLDEDDFLDINLFKNGEIGRNIISRFCNNYCILDCQEDCPLFKFKKIKNLEILINDET